MQNNFPGSQIVDEEPIVGKGPDIGNMRKFTASTIGFERTHLNI